MTFSTTNGYFLWQMMCKGPSKQKEGKDNVLDLLHKFKSLMIYFLNPFSEAVGSNKFDARLSQVARG